MRFGGKWKVGSNVRGGLCRLVRGYAGDLRHLRSERGGLDAGEDGLELEGEGQGSERRVSEDVLRRVLRAC